MPACTYFLRGACKFGDRCRNEHAGGSSQSQGGFGNQTWTASSSDANAKPPVPFTVVSMEKDITPDNDKPLWPLSSYGPAKHEPVLIAGLDESFEELRVKAVVSLKDGNANGYLKYESEKIAAADQAYGNARSNMSQAFEKAVGQSPNTAAVNAFGGSVNNTSNTINAASAFGGGGGATNSVFSQTSAFGTSTATSAFGKPAFGQSAFGQASFGQTGFNQNASGTSAPAQPANTSAFAQPSQTTSAFGQPAQGTSAFGQQPSQPASAFGQASQPTSAFAQPTQSTSTFGQSSQPTTSAFGQPVQPPTSAFEQPTQPTTAFSQPSQPTSTFGQSSLIKPATGAFSSGGGAFSAFASQSSGFATAAAANNSQSTTTGGFGQSSFGTPAPAQSAFASTTTPATTSAFASTPSAFASQSAPISAFGTSAFGISNPSGSAFASNQPNTGGSIFGNNANNASAFGQPQQPQPSSALSGYAEPVPMSATMSDTPISTTAPGFLNIRVSARPDADKYAVLLPQNYFEMVPENVKAAFQSEKFDWGDVPEWIPPMEVR